MSKTKAAAPPAPEAAAARPGPSEAEAAAQRAGHKARLLALLGAGYVVRGLRINDPADAERGAVITFDEAEQKRLAAVLTEIVSARG